MVTGDRAAYEYLEASAAKFPCGADFVALMQTSAPFAKVTFEPLTLGIAYLYVGITASRRR